MKVKILSFLAFTFFCCLFIQSCSSEFSDTESGEVEALTIESTDASSAIAPSKVYCRYNVTESGLPGIEPGSIICVKCDYPCAKKLTKYKGTHLGNTAEVSGTRVGKACKKCPTGGVPL